MNNCYNTSKKILEFLLEKERDSIKMKINKISPATDYNRRTVQNPQKQNNPSFGKLIIDNFCYSTELIKELVRNPEIKKLVRLFDNVGINLKAIEYTTNYYTHAMEAGTHLRLVDPKKNR